MVNYDLPDDPEVYIHRIGRTARAGRKGIAWSYVTPEQGQLLTEIEKLTGVLIEKLDYPDFKPGPVPEDIAVERQREADRRGGEPLSPGERLAKRAAPAEYADLSEEELKKMFPSGRVPKSPPKRTLGSRLRSKRR